MRDALRHFAKWLKDTLAEPEGQASAARLVLVVTITTACSCLFMLTGIVVYLTIKLGHIPDLAALSEYAKIVSGFGGGAGGGTYGFNQVKRLFGAKLDAKDPTAGPPSPDPAPSPEPSKS